MTPEELRRSWFSFLAKDSSVRALDPEAGTFEVFITPIRGEGQYFHVFVDAQLLAEFFPKLSGTNPEGPTSKEEQDNAWSLLTFYLWESIHLNAVSDSFVLRPEKSGFEPDARPDDASERSPAIP